MTQKQITVVKPTSISQALIMASKNSELIEQRGLYLEQEYNNQDEPVYSVCAVGGMFVTVASHRAIQKQLDEENPELMIKMICKEISGACDPVPWNVWVKYHKNDYDGATKEQIKAYEKFYNDRKRNWVSLAEHMFESLEMSFTEIAKEFKKYKK